MARPKKQDEEQKTEPAKIDYGFFKQTVETDGVLVMKASEVIDPEPNRSGSFNLDYDLTIPFPEGRITEVFGPEATCKTTLGLEALGQAVTAGRIGLYVNMEKNLNLSLMRTVRTLRPILDEAIAQMEAGKVGTCPLWIVNARNGEQAFEAMRKFASMVPRGVAVLDSIDAAQPEAIMAGEVGESTIGKHAKLMSDAMHKLIGVAEQNKVSLIFINQIRDKITMYGDPTTTPGGKALKFYASQRIQLFTPRKDDIITDVAGERIGVVIRYKVIKNKVAPDGSEGAFPILFNNGVFREQELVTRCANFGIVKMGGQGGKQVFIPVIDRQTGEYVIETKKGLDGKEVQERKEIRMTQFQAAKRLLLDAALTKKLEQDLLSAVDVHHSAVDALLEDEVQESEQ